MMHANMLSPPEAKARAVYVEACHEGVEPQTMVKVVSTTGGTPREERHYFDTLAEALSYAQTLREPTD